MATLSKLMVELGFRNNMGPGIKSASKDAKGLGGVLKTSLGVAGGIFAAAATTGILGFGKSLLMANANAETMRNSLNIAIGDVERAGKVFDELQAFAASTPFEFPELMEAAVRLESFGVDAMSVIDMLGDTAAAQGRSLEQVTAAYLDAGMGQYQRLAELGIDVADLGDTVRLRWFENGQMMEKIVADNGEAVQGVLSDIWSRYDGAMETQSQSFLGRLSTFKDNLNLMFQDLSLPLFNIAKAGLGFANEWFTEFGALRGKGVKPLAAAMAALQKVVANAFGPKIAGRMTDLIDSFIVLGKTVKDVVSGALKLLVNVFELLIKHWNVAGPILRGLAIAIGIVTVATTLWAAASGVLAGALALIFSPITLIVLVIAALYVAWETNFLGIRDLVMPVVERVVDAFNVLIATFDLLTNQGMNPFRAAWIALGQAIEDLTGFDVSPWFSNVADAVGLTIALLRVAWAWFLDEALPVIAAFARGVWGWIVDTAVPAFARAYDAVADFLQPIVDWIVATGIPNVATFAQSVWSWIIGTAMPAFKAIFDEANRCLAPIFGWMIDEAIPAVVEWVGKIQDAGIDVRNAFIDIWTFAEPKLQALWDWWVSFRNKLVEWVGLIQDAGVDVRIAFQDIWNKAEDSFNKIKGVWEEISGAIGTFVETITGYKDDILGIFGEIGSAIDAIPWDKIPFVGGGDDGGSGARGPQVILDQIADDQIAQDMAGPLLSFLNGTLPPILTDIEAKIQQSWEDISVFTQVMFSDLRLLIDNAWLDIKADTTTITDQIRQEAQITFWDMQNDLAMHMFGTRNRVADAWIGVRADTTSLAFGTRNAAVNEFVGMRQDVDRNMSLVLTDFGLTMRLLVTDAERYAFQARNAVVNQLVGLRNDGASLGHGVGSAIGGGIWGGMAAWVRPIADLAGGMVRGAINAARAEAQVASPSKKMLYVGDMMAQGLLIPLRAAEREVEGLLGGVIGGAPRYGAVPALAGGAGSHAVTNNYYALTAEDLRRLLEQAERGARFADGFGTELPRYRGGS